MRVERTPLTSTEPIEILYNPKQTGTTFDNHRGKVRRERREGDEEEPEPQIEKSKQEDQ